MIEDGFKVMVKVRIAFLTNLALRHVVEAWLHVFFSTMINFMLWPAICLGSEP